MKDKKNILIGVLIGIIVILMGLCVYLVFSKKEEVRKEPQKLTCECNDNKENMVENNIYFSTIESDIKRDASYEISNPKLPKSLEIATYNENNNQSNINVTLSKDGKLLIKQDGKEDIKLQDVNTAIDIEGR